jgi:glycine betaine/choline ABC-type transport system substrate-binding protein
MTVSKLSRLLFALAVCALLAVGIAACGDDSDDESTSASESAEAIQDNPDNHGVELTIGSKNFTEEYILGDIYAEALEAAGYDIKTDLNVGDSPVAVKALEDGEISGYPDYTSTVLTTFFETPVEDVPHDAQEAADVAQGEFESEGLTSFAPTPFADANAVGTLTTTADELGLETVSDLEGQSEDLTLYGSPECPERPDCLLGLEDDYGLKFKDFTSIDIGLRYQVLDKGDADLSILFTSDAQLFNSDTYTVLEDDQGVFPAGNVIFITDPKVVDEAGPDYQSTIEAVQAQLTLPVIQELNARVDLDKQKPEDVAHDYLVEGGYLSD